MDNTNIQAFLDSLTEEQRAAVLACKTAEELDRVIDDYDIEIPDEMMADVAGGKGVAPFLLAGIMALTFTVGAAAPVYAASESGSTSVSMASASSRPTPHKYVSDWTEEKDAIEDLFWELDYDQDNFFNCFLEDENTSKTQVVQNADGSVSIIQKKRVEDKETCESFAISNADANTIYPGALLKANQGLITGNPTPIRVQRRKLNITIPGAYMKDGCDSTVLVDPTNGGNVNDEINKLRSNFKENTDMPAQLDARIEKVESEEQIKAKMNFSEELWGKVKVSASTDYQTKSQAVVVDISQVFYSVSADNMTDADLFPDTMTAKRLQRYINSEEPPVVVSNVNYGKRIIACIQTDDMSFDLKASVEVEALGGKIKGDAEAEYKEKLSNCTVKVFAIGGSSKAAGEYLTMSVDDLMKAARSNTAFDGYAVPVSYTTRWAKDGSIARTNYTGYNWETVEMKKLSDSIPVSFKFEPIDTIKVAQYRGTKEPPKVTGSIDHLLTKGTVSIYGRKIVGVNADGSLVRSDEQLLKTVTFDYETMDSFKLSGDVLADSVKFVFDYEGYDQNKRSEAERTILLKDACGGLDKISKYEGFELEVTKSWGSYDPNDVGFIMGTCRAKEKDSSNKKACSVKLDREEKNTCPML